VPVNLDFNRGSRRALSEAFARLLNQLPEQWSQWISQVSRNSRVFTQIGKTALNRVRIPDQTIAHDRVGSRAAHQDCGPPRECPVLSIKIERETVRYQTLPHSDILRLRIGTNSLKAPNPRSPFLPGAHANRYLRRAELETFKTAALNDSHSKAPGFTGEYLLRDSTLYVDLHRGNNE